MAHSRLLFVSFLLLFPNFLLAQNPVPLVNQPVVPMTVTPGSPGFTLTVKGAGFVPGAVVQWNGKGRPTRFVNHKKVTAKIPASDLTLASTASVTVLNPTPGGGRSNAVLFQVTSPVVRLSFKGLNLGIQSLATQESREIRYQSCWETEMERSSPHRLSYTVVGTSPTQIIAADFNSDRHLDLAVLDPSSSGVSILLGNGDGTFQNAVSVPAGMNPVSAFAADLNGDGKLDLAVANIPRFSPGTVSILLGNGDGTFQPPVPYVVGLHPNFATAGDFLDRAAKRAVGQSSPALSIACNGPTVEQTAVHFRSRIRSRFHLVSD